MSALKPGTLASVPLTGICEVMAVETIRLLGEDHRMVVLDPQDEESLVKIPENQLEQRGVRPLAKPARLQELLAHDLEVEAPTKNRPTHRRIQRWTDILRSQGVGARMQVLAEIQVLEESGKKLNKKERAFHEMVRLNLRHELEQVLKLTPVQAGLKLSNAI